MDPFCRRELTAWRVVVQLLQPEARLVVCYRLYSWMHRRGWFWPSHLMHLSVRGRTGCEIAPNARIGPGLRVEHRSDVVIGDTAVLGSDVSIYNGVSLGKRRPPWEHEMPTIGSRVILGAGAKILGAVSIGDDAIVAANAVVLKDVEARSMVAGNPARPIGAAPVQDLGPVGASPGRRG